MKTRKLTNPCCSPLLAGAIEPESAAEMATLFRVLGEPARLQLLGLIAQQPEGEICACDLVEPLGLSQPTVSHHLKVLYEAGLLDKERRGTWIYYRLVPEPFERLRAALAIPQIPQP
ncbi:MAG: metalloregulator ArsR/SmtB family transcription factor [Oculatellaceae cyanobacterium Prado106]|nr:metalloregulator ArsR/SmtB family transcription factor [Oculatellaceae cyanobacterium Prado106]